MTSASYELFDYECWRLERMFGFIGSPFHPVGYPFLGSYSVGTWSQFLLPGGA